MSVRSRIGKHLRPQTKRRVLEQQRMVVDRAWRVRVARQRQALLRSDVGVRRVVIGRHVLCGRVVEEFSAEGAAAYNLGLVADALERAGVSYFLVPGVSRRAFSVGVSEGDRERFFAAMRELYAGSVVFVGRPRAGSLVNVALFADAVLPKVVLSARVVRFGVVHLGPSGQVLAGWGGGVGVSWCGSGGGVVAAAGVGGGVGGFVGGASA